MAEEYTATMLLTTAHTGLREIGYREELLQEAYEFADMLDLGQARRIELAAFAQEPPSYRNACIGVALPPQGGPEAIMAYRALGAPQILAFYPKEQRVLRWKMLAHEKPEVIEQIDPAHLRNAIWEHRAEWSPEQVLRAKSIRFRSEATQLDFFDLGFLPALEHRVYEKLDTLLGDVLATCKSVYKEHHDREPDYGALFRLIFRLVAAKLLGDRRYPGNWLSSDAQGVIRAVEDFYSQHMPPESALDDLHVQNAAWQKIRTAFSFRNLSVEALAYVYENTLVSPETRRAYGTHATQPEIAEYIVQSLPFEDLALNERHVFEPFCGHAPFLIAALGRLRNLLPADRETEQRHDYLVQMLSGMELDTFAREVARYSLILADYPNPNGWRIEQDNVFTSPRLDYYLEQAKIVLCNPPYEDFTPGERQSNLIHTSNKAVEALRRVLQRPPAMLGFVLPRLFASGQSFRDLRKQLVSLYNEITLVELPDIAFNHSEAETTIVIAHGQRAARPLWRSMLVERKDYQRFLRTAEPTWQTVTDSTITGNEADITLWDGRLQNIWDALADLPRLKDIADIHRGIEYNIPVKGNETKLISDMPRPGFSQGLFSVSDDFEPYATTKFVYLNTDPKKMQGSAYKLPWDRPKVIVNAARRSRTSWTITATIAYQSLVCYQNFDGIWPTSDIPLEVIAALLNSPIANAFLSTHNNKRHNKLETIKQIPVPELSPSQIHLIVSLVREYIAFRDQWRANPEHTKYFEDRCKGILRHVDGELLTAYHLPLELERELVKYFDGYERPGPATLKQIELAPARRPYTAIMRVENIKGENDNKEIEATVSSWDPYQTVRFSMSLVPEHIREKLAQDVLLFAQVNIGARKAEDLYFENIELAPELEDDGLA